MSFDNGYDEKGNKINNNGGDTTDYKYNSNGEIVGSTAVLETGNGSRTLARGYGYKANGEYATGSITEDNTIFELYAGGKAIEGLISGIKWIRLSLVAKTGKTIVIGEGMGAIKTTSKTLQSQGINAKWYQAWSKNFPTNRLMTPAELSSAQARNARWLNSKINQGYKIYDIGIDVTRATRSPFYQLERNIIQQRGYPTTVIPR